MHFTTTSIMAVLAGLIATSNARIMLGNTVSDNRQSFPLPRPNKH